MMTYCSEIISAPVELELSVGFLGVGESIVGFTFVLWCRYILFCVFTIFGITVKPPLEAELSTPHVFNIEN